MDVQEEFAKVDIVYDDGPFWFFKQYEALLVGVQYGGSPYIIFPIRVMTAYSHSISLCVCCCNAGRRGKIQIAQVC